MWAWHPPEGLRPKGKWRLPKPSTWKPRTPIREYQVIFVEGILWMERVFSRLGAFLARLLGASWKTRPSLGWRKVLRRNLRYYGVRDQEEKDRDREGDT